MLLRRFEVFLITLLIVTTLFHFYKDDRVSPMSLSPNFPLPTFSPLPINHTRPLYSLLALPALPALPDGVGVVVRDVRGLRGVRGVRGRGRQ